MKCGVLGDIAMIVQLGVGLAASTGCLVDQGTNDTYVRMTSTGVMSAVQVNTTCSCGSYTRTGSCSGGTSGFGGGGDVPINPDAGCTCELNAQQIPVLFLRGDTEIARGIQVQGNFAGAELVVEGHHAIIPDAFPPVPQLGTTDDGNVGWELAEPFPVLGTVTSFDGTGKTCREPADSNYMPVKWPSSSVGGFVSIAAQHVVEADGLHVWLEAGASVSTNGGF